MSQDKKNQINDALQTKGALRPCERCGSGNFSLLDDFVRFDLQSDLQSVSLGGPAVPAVSIACNNCGNLTFFAVKSLLPNEF
ncbi:hypothetical protein M3598_01040 [Cytobacillus oceanisediminis]|uniref:hypothetical protein n=1 Tax=Cytobacillus oceanisediminis TaxID=665099 RepID=UPI00203D44C4|nr:hypothetical protein [Cytobacillus oceanisediminis]MCM3241316.1 hypothetical protein [Cytobacillus oceanisediminis]